MPLHAARRTLRASRVVRWFCVLALLHTATPSLCMVVMKKLFLVAACFAMDDCLLDKNVQVAKRAGCIAHKYCGVSMLLEELVRVNLA